MHRAQTNTGHKAPTNTGTATATGTDRHGPAPHLPRQAATGPTPAADPTATAAPTTPATPATTPADRRQPTTGSTTDPPPHPPLLRHRRDGVLPNVAAALSLPGTTLTGTAARGDPPPALHPLVQEFLDALPGKQRDRFTGRCAETLLISRRIGTAESTRSKRAQRKPISHAEARKALKGTTLTTRRIREDGDPLHGSYATPCQACRALAAHFGVRLVNTTGTTTDPGTGPSPSPGTGTAAPDS